MIRFCACAIFVTMTLLLALPIGAEEQSSWFHATMVPQKEPFGWRRPVEFKIATRVVCSGPMTSNDSHITDAKVSGFPSVPPGTTVSTACVGNPRAGGSVDDEDCYKKNSPGTCGSDPRCSWRPHSKCYNHTGNGQYNAGVDMIDIEVTDYSQVLEESCIVNNEKDACVYTFTELDFAHDNSVDNTGFLNGDSREVGECSTLNALHSITGIEQEMTPFTKDNQGSVAQIDSPPFVNEKFMTGGDTLPWHTYTTGGIHTASTLDFRKAYWKELREYVCLDQDGACANKTVTGGHCKTTSPIQYNVTKKCEYDTSDIEKPDSLGSYTSPNGTYTFSYPWGDRISKSYFTTEACFKNTLHSGMKPGSYTHVGPNTGSCLSGASPAHSVKLHQFRQLGKRRLTPSPVHVKRSNVLWTTKSIKLVTKSTLSYYKRVRVLSATVSEFFGTTLSSLFTETANEAAANTGNVNTLTDSNNELNLLNSEDKVSTLKGCVNRHRLNFATTLEKRDGVYRNVLTYKGNLVTTQILSKPTTTGGKPRDKGVQKYTEAHPFELKFDLASSSFVVTRTGSDNSLILFQKERFVVVHSMVSVSNATILKNPVDDTLGDIHTDLGNGYTGPIYDEVGYVDMFFTVQSTDQLLVPSGVSHIGQAIDIDHPACLRLATDPARYGMNYGKLDSTINGTKTSNNNVEVVKMDIGVASNNTAALESVAITSRLKFRVHVFQLKEDSSSPAKCKWDSDADTMLKGIYTENSISSAIFTVEAIPLTQALTNDTTTSADILKKMNIGLAKFNNATSIIQNKYSTIANFNYTSKSLEKTIDDSILLGYITTELFKHRTASLLMPQSAMPLDFFEFSGLPSPSRVMAINVVDFMMSLDMRNPGSRDLVQTIPFTSELNIIRHVPKITSLLPYQPRLPTTINSKFINQGINNLRESLYISTRDHKYQEMITHNDYVSMGVSIHNSDPVLQYGKGTCGFEPKYAVACVFTGNQDPSARRPTTSLLTTVGAKNDGEPDWSSTADLCGQIDGDGVKGNVLILVDETNRTSTSGDKHELGHTVENLKTIFPNWFDSATGQLKGFVKDLSTKVGDNSLHKHINSTHEDDIINTLNAIKPFSRSEDTTFTYTFTGSVANNTNATDTPVGRCYTTVSELKKDLLHQKVHDTCGAKLTAKSCVANDKCEFLQYFPIGNVCRLLDRDLIRAYYTIPAQLEETWYTGGEVNYQRKVDLELLRENARTQAMSTGKCLGLAFIDEVTTVFPPGGGTIGYRLHGPSLLIPTENMLSYKIKEATRRKNIFTNREMKRILSRSAPNDFSDGLYTEKTLGCEMGYMFKIPSFIALYAGEYKEGLETGYDVFMETGTRTYVTAATTGQGTSGSVRRLLDDSNTRTSFVKQSTRRLLQAPVAESSETASSDLSEKNTFQLTSGAVSNNCETPSAGDENYIKLNQDGSWNCMIRTNPFTKDGIKDSVSDNNDILYWLLGVTITALCLLIGAIVIQMRTHAMAWEMNTVLSMPNHRSVRQAPTPVSSTAPVPQRWRLW